MSAPAVPAGDLAPGQARPVEDVIAGLASVYEVDPERAETLERSVLIDVFEAIAAGHQDPQGLASHALLVMRTRFPRCYRSAVDEADAIRDLAAQYQGEAQRLWDAIHESEGENHHD